MNLKFLLPFWMNSVWSCITQTCKNKQRPDGKVHDSASMATNLFMYIDSVKSPLVVLQKRRGGHRFIVLGADDDDDQIPLLCEEHKHPC